MVRQRRRRSVARRRRNAGGDREVHPVRARVPDRRGVRLADAGERAREILGIAQRDDPSHREHGQRRIRARAVAALGIGRAGRGERVGDAANAERPRGHQRDPVGAHHAGRADAAAVGRRHVLDAGRQPRAALAVAEDHARPCRRRRSGRCRFRSTAPGRPGAPTRPTAGGYAHLQRALHAAFRRRGGVGERRPFEREALVCAAPLPLPSTSATVSPCVAGATLAFSVTVSRT